MLWCLFLVALCATCCSAEDVSDGSSEDHDALYRDSRTLRGSTPNYEVADEGGYDDRDTSGMSYSDFLDIILQAIDESKHSSSDDVKFDVVKGLIKYMAIFNDMEGHNCNPTIKLFDITILAAKKLRQDYTKDSDIPCEYTKDMESQRCGPAIKLLDIIILVTKRLRQDYMKESDFTCEMPITIETQKPYPKGTEPKTTSRYVPTAKPTKKPHPGSTESQKTTSGYVPTAKPTMDPCTEEPSTTRGYVSTEKPTPCPEKPIPEPPTKKPSGDYKPTEEIIAEEDDYIEPSPPFVGSVRGIPGEHYPNYTEIPITSFSCADKSCIPGFYADLETGCQVFHVCYEHRRESFLCPVGTIFNQPILACDYWYSSNCSLAPLYYDVNCRVEQLTKTGEGDTGISGHIVNIMEGQTEDPAIQVEDESILPEDLDQLVKFLPVKAKVTEFTESEEAKISHEKPDVEDIEVIATDIFDKIVPTVTSVISKTRNVITKIPRPVQTATPVIKKPVVVKPKFIKPVVPLKVKPVAIPKVKLAGKIATLKVVPIAKFATTKAVVPILTKAKIDAKIASKLAAIGAFPVAAKSTLASGKLVTAKAAVPVVSKLVGGKLITTKAVPVAAKAKVVGAIPLAKAVAAKVAVPVIAKPKLVAGKVLASKVAVPAVAKTKLAAAVPIAAKAKFVVTSKAAVPVAAKVATAKVAVPIAKGAIAKGAIGASAAIKVPALKTKILAASIPFAKSTVLKSSVPIAKAKIAPALKLKVFKSASIPIVKGKLMILPLAKSKFTAPVPLMKAKLAKAVAISPLTKKALALGYMKLLKAKKLALLG